MDKAERDKNKLIKETQTRMKLIMTFFLGCGGLCFTVLSPAIDPISNQKRVSHLIQLQLSLCGHGIEEVVPCLERREKDV